MSHTGETLLGVIALATLVTAIIQVGAIVAVVMLVRRLERLTNQVEQDLKPIFAQATAIGRDASRATALVVAQVERVDRLTADFAKSTEQVFSAVQSGILGPAREGRALLSGLRAALAVIRHLRARRNRGGRPDDEDALFI